MASGLTFRRFAKIRHDMMAAGEKNSIVPEVPTPPEDSTTSEDHGGVLHGPGLTSTPGYCFIYVIFLLCFSFHCFLLYLIFSIFVKDPARELLRLRLLLERKDQELAQGRLELEKKELEWKMAGLHAKGVDQSGENTILGGNFSAMETSQLNKYIFILIFHF